MANWRTMLNKHLERLGIMDQPIIVCDGDFDREFYDGYGGSEGDPFTVWTEDYVFFPTVYDRAEWISYVRRNPCLKVTTPCRW